MSNSNSVKNIVGIIARSTNDKYANGYTMAYLTITQLDGTKTVYKEPIQYGNIEEPQTRFLKSFNETFLTNFNYFRALKLAFPNDIEVKHVNSAELTRLYKAWNNIFHLENIILWNKYAKALTKKQKEVCKASDVEVLNYPSTGWCIKSKALGYSFDIAPDYSQNRIRLTDKNGKELVWQFKVV